MPESMSKQGKRKITVDSSKNKDSQRRPSVFERLGTKATGSNTQSSINENICRHWLQTGSCPYGKTCK